MKVLKLLLCCLLAAFITSAAVPAVSARAATARYARADAKDVYFCERKDLNYALFTIPYTYCVEILSADAEWYYVKYAEDVALYKALYGYCLKEHLTPVEEPPDNIYLNMPVTVTFRPDAPAVGSMPVLSELNVTAAFYGTYYSGATAYSYVLYDGKFGYIYGANDNYPLNEIPEPEPPVETKTESGGSNAKLITILALAGVAALALIILYVSGRNRYFKP